MGTIGTAYFTIVIINLNNTMEISWKKLLFIIIVSFFALNVIFSAVWFFINYEAEPDTPNYDKIFSKEEAEKVLDDTIFALGGRMARKEHIETGNVINGQKEYRQYKAEFKLEEMIVGFYIDDMSKWSIDTIEMYTGSPDTTWDNYIRSYYAESVKMWSQTAEYSGEYYEDTHSLTEIMDYDVEIGVYNPLGEEYPNYDKRAETVIGNYKLMVRLEHESKIVHDLDIKPYLEIFIINFLQVLGE